MAKKKTPPKCFTARIGITGFATATFEAKDLEEAQAKARTYDFPADLNPIVEWEYDTVHHVEEDK